MAHGVTTLMSFTEIERKLFLDVYIEEMISMGLRKNGALIRVYYSSYNSQGRIVQSTRNSSSACADGKVLRLVRY